MSKVTTTQFTITGKSGTIYSFDIYTTDTKFKAIGGIYIFTKRFQGTDQKFYHVIIYCGKAEDLSTRFNDHHKQDCIDKNKANCICIKSVSTETERIEIETDILNGNNFKCNEVLN